MIYLLTTRYKAGSLLGFTPAEKESYADYQPTRAQRQEKDEEKDHFACP